jgi:protein TonB
MKDVVVRKGHYGGGQVSALIKTRLAVVPKPKPALFSDVLLESHAEFRRSRGPSTIASFVLLTLLFATLTMLPLLFTETLPNQQLLTTLIVPPPPPPPPIAPAAATKAIRPTVVRSEVLTNSRLLAPSEIPRRIAILKEETLPPAATGVGVVGGVPGGIPGGQLGGVIGGIINSTPTAAIVPKPAIPAPPERVVRISQGISEGLLLYKPTPPYPKIARTARIQGPVVLKAMIAKDGTIQNLLVVSGHPMLIPAALEGVRQWRYRPYLLNDEPVEVETQITVNFRLSGND